MKTQNRGPEYSELIDIPSINTHLGFHRLAINGVDEKKSNQPFKEVINDYLDKVDLTEKEKKEVLDIWRKRRPVLSLPIFEDKQSSDPKFILSDEVNLISKELIETLKNNF